jgi:dipeptidase D
MMQSCTDKILSYFDQINAIPRCSKDEARLGRWLRAWAVSRGFETDSDAAGNLVVRVPAAPGQEHRTAVVLQGHMDMVCEKTPESTHDFAKDPILSRREGDWLKADRTTLGADNGIAIAYAMTLSEDPDLKRPPMELLFTIDEETGLTGVKAMGPNLISGRILINLDSENEGIFTVGCAGGLDTTLKARLEIETPAGEDSGCRLTVGGLSGGHSGIDIHKQRGNAIKVVVRTISRILQVSEVRLASLAGGTRHNAIPRDAQALIVVAAEDLKKIEHAVDEVNRLIRLEYGSHEPEVFIRVEGHDLPPGSQCLTRAETVRALRLLTALPHGVAGMSPAIEGLVETSNNLAMAQIQDGQVNILSSQRSASASRLAEVTSVVHAVAELAGAACRDNNKYPAWQPDMDSPLLRLAVQTYQRLFGKDPIIEVIHAGLECAIIGERYPGIQMISFGPTIRGPHSPNERLYIPSIEPVWQLLAGLLESIE